MEMDDPGLERCRERLGVHPGEHEHGAVRSVLDDGRDEAGGSPDPLTGEGYHRTGHAAAAGSSRTGKPASAIACLTAAIEWIRRWKIDAARTASAPPSRTAATKSIGPAAPPEAMTGTSTRAVIARRSAVSNPERVP